MGFASNYLKERILFPELIKEAPHKDTGIIVIVPSCGEPAITNLLDSLASCVEPECKTEVIILVNAPGDSDPRIREANLKTLNEAETWKSSNPRSFFRTYPIDADTSAFSKWGVGMARKAGMDEAARRFDSLERPEGIILNLDADCTVERNYFRHLHAGMSAAAEKSACSIYFEHPLTGGEFPALVYRAIALYELHLRYYYQGLRFAGFPNVHHTVGSAIAVKALPYVRSGGMNRRMAGEDFYFVRKLVSTGGYFNLNTTAVYPSPRPSMRVPFGTGATIFRLTENDEKEFMTYNPEAFRQLRSFFTMTDALYDSGSAGNSWLYSELPESVSLFIGKEKWSRAVCEIKDNTASLKSFRKRFSDWFNMFRIVKYMNFVHQGLLKKKPVTEAANELSNEAGFDFHSADPEILLGYYRSLEKEF
ncbi:MAG: glycosyltransferase family 2 protein [Bacteroidales bacterium]|nr:glycosyltransferase family 2 protein [Bacteroidales bacterium]